jgi:hypothetical protein
MPVEALNVTPLGRVSVGFSLRLGGGEPEAVTVYELAILVVNVVLLGLVNAGGGLGGLTVSVKVCVASLPTPLSAVKCKV